MRAPGILVVVLLNLLSFSLWAEQGSLRVTEKNGAVVYAKNCAICHASKQWKHILELARNRAASDVVQALRVGTMRAVGNELTEAEHIAVAEYVTQSPYVAQDPSVSSVSPQCKRDMELDSVLGLQSYPSWGGNTMNTREVSLGDGVPANIGELNLKWAIAIPDASHVRAQVTALGSALFMGSQVGMVYALSQESGCTYWSFRADAEVRSAITLHSPDQKKTVAYFADASANVYAVEAHTGKLLWKVQADENPHARITGSITAHENIIVVPISTSEDQRAVDPAYPCCTHVGGVVAIDALTGSVRWERKTLDDLKIQTTMSPRGRVMRGPSGGSVWSTPTLDAQRGRIYVGTGNHHSPPATGGSDSILALDTNTGEVIWQYQGTPDDLWNAACFDDVFTHDNCPDDSGRNFDFGAAPVLVRVEQTDYLLAAQKSGILHALDPQTGNLLWKTRTSRGSILGGTHFGVAAMGDKLVVPAFDYAGRLDAVEGSQPGISLLRVVDGRLIWHIGHKQLCQDDQSCTSSVSSPPSVAGSNILVPMVDGKIQVLDSSGAILHTLDTANNVASLNGRTSKGGGIGGAAGPIVLNGRLIVTSGIGFYGAQLEGNSLRVYEVVSNAPVSRSTD